MARYLSSVAYCVFTFASILVIVIAGPGVATKQRLNDGNEIPTLGLGTFLGLDNKKWVPEEVREAVKIAIDAGYRHIDTAAIYRTEEQIGRAIAEKIEDGTVMREDLFITTKLWNDKHARDQVVPALKESLAKLGLEYVDLYLIHWPTAFTANNEIQNIDYLDTWKGMEEAKHLGLAKSIGVSSFNEKQLTRLLENSRVKPAVLQIEVNPNLTQQRLVKLAQNNSMVVMAFSPFGSLVGGRASANAPAPKVDDPILTAIAHKYGKTTPQIVLRYLVDRGLVPIPKSVNKNRIEQNINIFDFHLTEDEVNKIDEFNLNRRSVLPSFWQDHPDYPYEKIAHPQTYSEDPFSE